VEIAVGSVVVTRKNAHNRYLVASDLADRPTPMPWRAKNPIIQFA
jgi:hypothetical protein